MLPVKCSKCGQDTLFNEASGSFECKSCSVSLSVTDIDLPQLGSCKNTTYQAGKTKHNVFESNDKKHLYGRIIPDDECMIISNSIDEKKAIKIYNKWNCYGIFSPHKINSEFRKSGLKLKYVPAFLYNIIGYGAINSTATRFSESLTRKERISTTDYYSLERNAELHYNNICIFSSETDYMNKVNDYDYDKADIIKSNSLPDNILSCPVSEETRITNDINDNITSSINSLLNDTTKEYSSSYTEDKETSISITPIGKIYLPVWHFSYGQIHKHEIIINGQTGSVYATPIISKSKLLFAIALPSILLCILLCLILL